VENACAQARHTPLADMVRIVVEAFVDAKMEVSTSRGALSVCCRRGRTGAGETCGPALSEGAGGNASNGAGYRITARQFAIEMMFAAMAGASATSSSPERRR